MPFLILWHGRARGKYDLLVSLTNVVYYFVFILFHFSSFIFRYCFMNRLCDDIWRSIAVLILFTLDDENCELIDKEPNLLLAKEYPFLNSKQIQTLPLHRCCCS
jgi:hypothetical protein